MLNYTTIPVIVVICYVIITAIKATKIDSRWYPLISCVVGAMLAAAMFFVMPEFICATSLVVAMISGAVIGLAATGTDQVFKQLMKAAENGTITEVNIQNAAAPVHNEATNVGKTNDTGGNPEG